MHADRTRAVTGPSLRERGGRAALRESARTRGGDDQGAHESHKQRTPGPQPTSRPAAKTPPSRRSGGSKGPDRRERSLRLRTLTLSIGNTSLFGGVFEDERLIRAFRLPHAELRQLPARAGRSLDRAALCSVVPALTSEIVALIRRGWRIRPRVLTAGSAPGLAIGYRRPRELGTDRLAAALGARALFPRRNVIVVDCGTATTVTALRRDGRLLGGAILPGVTLWVDALATRTAQLPRVELRRPRTVLGRSPGEAIGSGVFFGHVGALRELIERTQTEAFGRRRAVVIGTGGHAAQFLREGLFDAHEPALVLQGLKQFAELA